MRYWAIIESGTKITLVKTVMEINTSIKVNPEVVFRERESLKNNVTKRIYRYNTALYIPYTCSKCSV